MVYVVLPAYNEEDALRPLLHKIDGVMQSLGEGYRVVAVDDGSHDGTAGILRALQRQYPIDVLTHKYNRGLGETIRDAFEYVAERAHAEDVIVRMDCDDTHDPKYIPSMLNKLAEGNDVVTASRYAPGGGQVGLDWYRRGVSRSANLLFKLCFNVPGVWEYSCGFRAYRVAVVQDALAIFGNKFIDLKGMGFTGTLEKLIKFRMMGARIAEVPFVLRYDQKLSSSKIITSLTTLGCVMLILKYIRFWNVEGQRWKRAIADRKRRLATEAAEARETPVPSEVVPG